MVKVSNATTAEAYWELLNVEQGIRVQREKVGANAVTERSYEQLTGRLSTIQTTDSGQLVQSLGYQYDPAGNMSYRADWIAQTQEGFIHDPVNRLLKVLGDDGVVLREYTYDSPHGRFSNRSDVGAYSYRSDGRDWIDHAGPNQYEPDALGRIRLRSGPNVPGGTQQIDYTTFNLPKRITNGTSAGAPVTDFGYDASGTRVVKQSGTTRTYYAGDLYQATLLPTGETSHRFMVYAGGRAVAQVTRTESGSTVGPASTLLLHDDALGSIQTTTGASVSSQHFEPFGQVSPGGPLSSTAPYGFTGQEHDSELGLVNMHGRMYDAELGQFLSPDPILQEPYGQGLNRFAYVFNSPVSNTDPSGFIVADNGALSINGAAVQTGSSFADFDGVAFAADYSATAGVAPGVDAGGAGLGAGIGAGDYGGVAATPTGDGPGNDGTAGTLSQIGMNFVVNSLRQPTPAAPRAVPVVRSAVGVQGAPSYGAGEQKAWGKDHDSQSIAAGANGSRTPPRPPSLHFSIKSGTLTVHNTTQTYSIHATTGRKECMNNPSPECMTKLWVGPVVPGRYTILSSELSDSMFKTWWRNRNADWGSFRVSLHPDAATAREISRFKRTGNFFLHGGKTPGSAGCIDCAGGIGGDAMTERLVREIKYAWGGQVELTVEPE